MLILIRLIDLDDRETAHFEYITDIIRGGLGSVQQTTTTVLRIQEQLKIQESSDTSYQFICLYHRIRLQ
jgi:hypothetical protein